MNTDTSNTRTNENSLKGFDKHFRGSIRYFQRNWFMPFIMALGSISMDNVTLRDTWLGVDHGGPNGPNANAAQNAQRQGRIRRIYAVLLNYIDPRCAVYDEIVEMFPDDGISALNYIQMDGVGNIPLTNDEIQSMNNDWNTMDYKKMPDGHKCEDTSRLIYDWGNAVKTQARRFPVVKSLAEQYDKFLSGMPTQLQQKVMDERENGLPAATALPAVYPPNYPDPALAGQPHPNAGEPDMTKVIAKYSRYSFGN